MVTTRAFIGALSRTVMAHPSLIVPAYAMYLGSRARQASGIFRYLPSRRYLAFRFYTQYGDEKISKDDLRKDIYNYLSWVKNNR